MKIVHHDTDASIPRANDPAGFNQIGCVYTAQGFEYDYGGVIIGPDLVWRTDYWVVRPEFNQDTQLKRGDTAGLERAILNTYKVLLTRSMRRHIRVLDRPQDQRPAPEPHGRLIRLTPDLGFCWWSLGDSNP